MAITGILIVMTGLAVLSFVISQLQRIAKLVENKVNQRGQVPQRKQEASETPTVTKSRALDLAEAKQRLEPLAAQLGDTFELQHLYELANSGALPHVHLSIRSLRESGVLVPVKNGRFKWQN
jgi:uncharacterized membrane protein YcjF (UPF0283 family)